MAEDGKVGRKGGLTWHDLRHEFVSFLVDQGGEIHEVREAARHKDIRTTERYMKAREVQERHAAGMSGDQTPIVPRARCVRMPRENRRRNFRCE